ncbi:MAG: rRNA adenine N-6-methyltransferase family protein [Candidatus Woesearchaeota archaeon]
MKVVIDKKGNKYFWQKGELHTSLGVIKDVKNGIVKSNLGNEFIVFDAGFVDKLEKIKRGPAIILKKDVGEIVAHTGISQKSKIVEGGSGCGVLAAFLGNVSDNVVSYEKNRSFFEIAKKNLEFLGVQVKLKNKDLHEGIDEKNLDLVVLDLLDPWKVFLHAKKSLKSGGFLVCYLTNINQVMECAKNLEGFYLEKVLENIERGWVVDGFKVRPEHNGLMHTGFLLFARRV